MQTTTERLLSALGLFFDLRQTLPARCIQAFLLVAAYPNESVTDYAKRAGMSHSSMGRTLADIGPRNRSKDHGFGLIDSRGNPDNISHKQFFLTAKGKKLLGFVLACIVEGEEDNARNEKSTAVDLQPVRPQA